MRSILFQILEYGGIPIGLMLFHLLNNKLASPDPISDNLEKDDFWERGLELTQIIFVSTLLFGFGVLGNSDTNGPNPTQSKVIIISLILAIAQLIVIMILIMNTRKFGKSSIQNKRYTNISALVFWLSLVLLISISFSSLRSNIEQPSGSKVTMHSPIVVNVLNDDSTISKKSFFLISGVILFIVVTVIILVTRIVIKRNRASLKKTYSTAILLATRDKPEDAIIKLQASLKKAPKDSVLVVDIYMKLAVLYISQNDTDKAIEQITCAQQSQTYLDNVYVRDAVLAFLIDLDLTIGKIDDAEQWINNMSSSPTSEKLKARIWEASKKGDPKIK